MEDVKQILLRKIAPLNREEQRDNRPRFSFNFLENLPGLWAAMYACHALAVALIFTTASLS